MKNHITDKVSNLTLDLFFFNIRQGLGHSEDQKQKLKQFFLEDFRFFETLQDSLKIALQREHEARNPRYTKLLCLAGYPNGYYSIEKIDLQKNFDCLVDGYYYPILLGDAYGVLLQLELKDNNLPLNYFKKLQNNPIFSVSRQSIEENGRSIEVNIGKTWMLSCRTEQPKDSEAIAETIYKEFISEILPDRAEIEYYWQNNCSQGCFLGAKIFEIWIPPQRWDTIKDNHHIVIIIFPNTVDKIEDFNKTLSKFYDSWMLAFVHRNKILYAYLQTRRLKRELTIKFGEILETIQFVKRKPTVKQLQNHLEDKTESFSYYVYHVNELKAQLNTIKINLRNYSEDIQYLNQQGQQKQKDQPDIGNTNLTPLLKSFTNNGTSIYEDQIEHDHSSLNGGIEMIDTLLNTIRGIVETRQSQRDRNFQELVGIIGIGLGSASITASAVSSFVPQQIEEWQTVAIVIDYLPIPKPLINRPVIALSLSVLSGIFFALITSIVVYSLRKKR